MSSSPQLNSDNPDERDGKGGKARISIWRKPLIHFFLLGLVVFGLYGLFEEKQTPAEDRFLVEISSADIEWFRTMWRKRMGREPTVEELRGQANQMIRDQILSREAVSLGLDEGDMVVRRRLAQKMDFLFTGLAEADEPSDDELRAFLQEHSGLYEVPGRVTFSQIYFNADERGDAGAADAARQLVEELTAKEAVPTDVSALGDPFLLPSNFHDEPLPEIGREFGPQFAEAVWAQEPGVWHGPVASGYGLHVIRVHERSQARLPEFSDLKGRLKADWLAARQRELAAEAYNKLRERYRVLVEGMPYDMDTGG